MSVEDHHHHHHRSLAPPPPPPPPPPHHHHKHHHNHHHNHNHNHSHRHKLQHYTRSVSLSLLHNSTATATNHMPSSILTSEPWSDSTIQKGLSRGYLSTGSSPSIDNNSSCGSSRGWDKGTDILAVDGGSALPRQQTNGCVVSSSLSLHSFSQPPLSDTLKVPSFVQSDSHPLARKSFDHSHAQSLRRDGYPSIGNIHSNVTSSSVPSSSSFGPSSTSCSSSTSSSSFSSSPLAQTQQPKSCSSSVPPTSTLSDPSGNRSTTARRTTTLSSMSLSPLSFSSSLMAKNTLASNLDSNSYSNLNNNNDTNTNSSSSPTSPKPSTTLVDNFEDVMDIESCIDNPVLAPLGRHVNRRRTPKRVDKDHIDINVVRPTSSSTFIQEQERESHAPVTSLILRRRRLDCEQLEHYLYNLQPTLDPQTMSILKSPLLHLTELDLSRNKLAQLPDNITSLVPYLVYLNLSHNLFTEIPMQLCRLSQLQVLIMSQNRIEGPVPIQICSSLTQLKTLRLCANQITSLPHTMARLERLESLSMGSVFGGNILTSFPKDCIQYMTALRELDLSHNKLCYLPADIGHPGSHLRQLVASDNKLEAIPKSIGLCKELRSLNLGRNQLTSLPTEIADLKQLDTLDLSENLLCVIPGDVADFLTKTTLLLTGNPFTRGYCDANRNPVSEIGGLGINYSTDEDRYAAVLKSLSRRAILNSASSSSGHIPTLASLTSGVGGGAGAGGNGSTGTGGGRESPRPPSTTNGDSYEMDQDERLDYHLYYTRHALSSRPPSRAESVSSLNESGGGYGSDYGGAGSWMDPSGPGTPRVHAEAVISDIDSFFDYIPSLSSSSTNITTAAISPGVSVVEPSIFDGAESTAPATPLLPLSVQTLPAEVSFPQILSPVTSQGSSQSFSSAMEQLSLQLSQGPSSSSMSTAVSPLTGSLPTTTSTPTFFPTLRELAARAVLHSGQPLPLEYIPEQVIDYLQPGARPCAYCRRPYVKEWVSSVRVKSYLGHPAVARRVRFCSSDCWRQASEQMEAEEAISSAGPAPSTPSSAFPGTVTGHLPPVVATPRGCSEGGASCTGIPDEDDLADGSPPGSLPTSPKGPIAGHGMRTCKGGQTYWPVIARRRRPRSSSSSSGTSVSSTLVLTQGTEDRQQQQQRQHTMDASGTLTPTTATTDRETGVCSGGCLGGGVCEW